MDARYVQSVPRNPPLGSRPVSTYVDSLPIEPSELLMLTTRNAPPAARARAGKKAERHEWGPTTTALSSARVLGSTSTRATRGGAGGRRGAMAGPGGSPLRSPAGLGGAWARKPLLAGPKFHRQFSRRGGRGGVDGRLRACGTAAAALLFLMATYPFWHAPPDPPVPFLDPPVDVPTATASGAAAPVEREAPEGTQRAPGATPAAPEEAKTEELGVPAGTVALRADHAAVMAPAVDPGLWELGGVPPRDPAGSLDPRERTIFYLRIQKTGSNSFQQRILPPSRPGAVSPCDNASDRSLCGYGLRISAAVKRALGEAGLERKVANACACDFYLKVERIRHLTGHANDVSTRGSGRRRTGD